ncbi:MAG: hypothetical protein ACRD3S_19010, partial [Terracidiphilus sp.]
MSQHTDAMMFLSNSGFVAVGFMECSAAFLLLVLYWLLLPGFPARFFRYWLAAWSVYVGLECARVASFWSGGQGESDVATLISPVVAGLIFAAAVECAGRRNMIRYLWASGIFAESALIALRWVAALPRVEQWVSAILVSSLYLAAGWILWRSRAGHRGAGWTLLSASLLLAGLDGVDRPEWVIQQIGLLRISFHGLLEIAIGVAMAVLILEAGRARAEDLNDRLRRLAEISAQAMQTPRSDAVFQGILTHVVESLSATHGLVLLFDDLSRRT